jgi:two-component system, chemotaxis family, CheB/CheR fusion protein
MGAGIVGLILHVEDDRSVRDSMALLLCTEGYDIRSAASGAEALQLVSGGFRPDVLIMDFNLQPHMNGAEAAEGIGEILNYVPPTIMLTGNMNSAKTPRIVEVVVWMTCKPLNPQLLLATLPGLVQISRATRNLFAPSP